MPKKKITLPMQTRSAVVTPSSINDEERTIDVVWTTGAKVDRCDWWTGKPFVEELEISEDAIDMTRLNNGAPFLDSHNSWGTDAVIGAVDAAKIENGQGIATIRFLKGDEVADKIWNKIKQGILRSISVGYSVEKYVETLIDGIRNLKAVRWTPLELSIVAVPADAGASVRANEKKSECVIESHDAKKERNMPKKLNKRAEAEIKAIVEEEKDKVNEVIAEAQDKLDEIKAEAEEKIAEVSGEEVVPADGSDEERDEVPASEEDKEKEKKDEETRKAKRGMSESRTSEILDICALAGVDASMARSFINQGKSPRQVREFLVSKRAADFEKNATVSTNQPVASKASTLAERAAKKFQTK